MSVLTYNGIQFGPECWLTLGFETEAVRDPSGTDLMYVRITITGSGILAPKVNPQRTQLFDHLSPAAAFTRLAIVNEFYQPRKDLSFVVNGVEMIPENGPDDRNGPQPVYFNLKEINTAAFAFELKIVSHWAMQEAAIEDGYIVSHRWSQQASIDRQMLTTNTRNGKLVVSSNFFDGTAGNSIDGLRETLVTCSIAKGFVRERSSYTLSENGLELGYTLTDREVFRNIPYPASDADGDFSIQTQRVGSIGRMASCRVMLRGQKNAASNPLILIKKAIAIAYAQLQADGVFFATSAEFSESLYENEVDVTISGRLNQQKKPKQEKQVFSLLAGLQAFGQAPAGNESAPPDPGSRGTANLLLHAAAWQDPTLQQTLDRKSNQITVQPGNSDMLAGVPGG